MKDCRGARKLQQPSNYPQTRWPQGSGCVEVLASAAAAHSSSIPQSIPGTLTKVPNTSVVAQIGSVTTCMAAHFKVCLERQINPNRLCPYVRAWLHILRLVWSPYVHGCTFYDLLGEAD